MFTQRAHCIVLGTDANQPYLNYRLRINCSTFKLVELNPRESEIIRCGNICAVSPCKIDNESEKSAIVGVNES